MGHKLSKKKTVEEDPEMVRALESFQQSVDEAMNSIMALKEQFTDPISDSLLDEYEKLESLMEHVVGWYWKLERLGCTGNPLDDRAKRVFVLSMMTDVTRRLPETINLREYEDKDDIPELAEMLSALKRAQRIFYARKERERKMQLFDAFELLYNRGDASQEELDKAYYAFAEKVCSYLRGYVADCRSGSYREAMAWNDEETGIENEFKKRFPKYSPPCSLNAAEKDPVCRVVVVKENTESKE